MVFNGFDLDATPNGESLFIWRKNSTSSTRTPPWTSCAWHDNGNLLVVGNANILGN